MKAKTSSNDLFYRMGIVFILCYFVYFSGVLVNLYNIFHEYSDFTLSIYNLYYNSHYPQIAHGLQLMAYDEHLSPDSLLLTAIYSVIQSPITLLITQLAFMCLTSYAILRMVREFTGDGFMALALSVAFLINAGAFGLIVYDSHVEFLIPLFYILTLYFYMKADFKAFVVSSILLLGSADVTPLMALTLGIGLVYYEFVHNKRSSITKTKVSFAYLLIALSVISVVLYSAATSSLESSYGTAYPNLPPTLRVSAGAQNMVGPEISQFASNPIGKFISNMEIFAMGYRAYLVYAILLVAFGFGLALFFDPVVALICSLPWLSGIFILGDPNFVLPLSEYFGYIIGPASAAAILGIMIYKKRDTWFGGFVRGLHLDLDKVVKVTALGLPILFSIVAPAIYLFAFSAVNQYHSVDAGNIGQILFFASNSSQSSAYSQLNFMLAQIPSNASVIAQYYDTAHIANRQYLESTGWNYNYSSPQYVLLDFNSNISNSMCIFDNCTKLYAFENSANYSVYLRNGTVVLYKRIS